MIVIVDKKICQNKCEIKNTIICCIDCESKFSCNDVCKPHAKNVGCGFIQPKE